MINRTFNAIPKPNPALPCGGAGSTNKIMKSNIIELPVPELKTALTGLSKIIGRKSTLPVLSSVRVSRDKSGVLTLQGTDLDSTATFTLKDAQEGPAAQMLVPFDRLQKAVKQSNGKVEIVAEKEQIILRTFWRDTPMEEKMSVPKNEEWPSPIKVEGECVKLDENFRTTFQQAMECASTEESRAVINSVYLDVDDKKGHYIVATNGRHLFSANSFAFGFKKSVIIPTRKFLGWKDWWVDGDGTLAIKAPVKANDTTWLEFKADQWTFLTRGQDLPFPNWKQVMPNQEARTTIVIPEQALAAVLQVLARLPGEDDFNKGVTLNTSNNTLVLSGRNKDQKELTSIPIIEAQIKGVPGEVMVNRDYMIRALKFGLNEIDILDQLSPVTFKSSGKKMIVMPLRPDTSSPVQTKPAPQPTATATATPPAEPTQTANQESKEMPKTTSTAPAVEQPQDSPLKLLIQQIENIKTTLKGVVCELQLALDSVKKADKEKRLAEKEIEAIREKVREIQSVNI